MAINIYGPAVAKNISIPSMTKKYGSPMAKNIYGPAIAKKVSSPAIKFFSHPRVSFFFTRISAGIKIQGF
jgi:hypothetical protein